MYTPQPQSFLKDLGNFMRSIHQLFYWEGLILLVGFFGIVCWKVLTGAIGLQYCSTETPVAAMDRALTHFSVQVGRSC
jgi:hypothetical protein